MLLGGLLTSDPSSEILASVFPFYFFGDQLMEWDINIKNNVLRRSKFSC